MEVQNRYINLIIKHLSKEISVAEQKEFDLLYAENKENKKVFEEYKQIWGYSAAEQINPEISNLDIDQEWKVQQQLTGLNTVSISPKKPGTDRFKWIKFAAAAAIIISIGLFAFLQFNTGTTQYAANNKTIEQQLPDGSTVTLFKHAELSFDNDFDTKQRTISLKGEAFFEVKSNPQKPFLVKTEKLSALVLGTKFSVKTAENGEVIVLEGKVKVTDAKSGEALIVVAGEKAFIGNDNKLQKQAVKNNNFIAWKTKKFTYQDATFGEIALDLEKAYGYKFVFENKKASLKKITVEFEGKTPEFILEVLKEQFADVKFVQKEKTIILK